MGARPCHVILHCVLQCTTLCITVWDIAQVGAEKERAAAAAAAAAREEMAAAAQQSVKAVEKDRERAIRVAVEAAERRKDKEWTGSLELQVWDPSLGTSRHGSARRGAAR